MLTVVLAVPEYFELPRPPRLSSEEAQLSSLLSTVTAMSSTTSASEDFRSVVLRGRNVASFKFALAKSVLSLAESGVTTASLEELAVPFSQELCAHIKEVDTTDDTARSAVDGLADQLGILDM